MHMVDIGMEDAMCGEFSRCGGQLAVCGGDGEVRIWESQTGVLKQRFKPAGSTVTCLSWSRQTMKVSRPYLL